DQLGDRIAHRRDLARAHPASIANAPVIPPVTSDARRWYRRRNVPHRLCNGDCIGSGHTLYESSSNRAACPRLPSHGTEMAVVSARVTSLEEVLADAPLPLEPGNGRPAVPPESQ